MPASRMVEYLHPEGRGPPGDGPPHFPHADNPDCFPVHPGTEKIRGMGSGEDAGTDQPVPFDNPSGHGHQQDPRQVGRFLGNPAVGLLPARNVSPDDGNLQSRGCGDVYPPGAGRHGRDQLQIGVRADHLGVHLVPQTAEQAVLPAAPLNQGAFHDRPGRVRMHLHQHAQPQFIKGRLFQRLGDENARLQLLFSLCLRRLRFSRFFFLQLPV